MGLTREQKVIKQLAGKAQVQKKTPIASDMFLPNHSGIATHPEAKKRFLKKDEVDEGVGLTLTGDNSSADTAYVPMVLYNTDAIPPAASGFPVGTIYIQYTA